MKTTEITLVVNDKGTAAIIKFSNNAKKSFDGVEKSAKKVDDAFGGITKKLVALTAGFLSFRAAVNFTNMVTGALEVVDSINKISERLGITTKLFQELNYAMKLSGVSQQEFEVGMRRLVTGIYDATKGTGLLVESMHKYGITAGDTESVLNQVANLIQRTTNEQERLNIATTFFGDRVGMAFVSLMKDGAAGLAKFKKEAQELGLILDKEGAESATKAKDALGKMGAVVDSLKNKLVIALAPALKDTADKTLEWYKKNQQLIDQKMQDFVKSLSDTVLVLAQNIDKIVAVLQVMLNIIGALLVGAIAKLVIQLGLWTTASITSMAYHIKGTVALYRFGLAAANGGRIMGLVTIAARAMWTAVGGPVGIAVGIAFILLQFIGIEKIVNALKASFDYILDVCKSIGTAISNWFAGGDTLDKQIASAEKRVEQERKSLESMKKMGGGVDDLRVAAARLAKEEAILATLKAQRGTTTTIGTGPSEAKYVGVVPTSLNYEGGTTGGVAPNVAAMTDALNKLKLARERILADTLEKERALALKELDVEMNAMLAKYEWNKNERLTIEEEYNKIRAATAETYDVKIRQKRMEILADTGKAMMEANAEFYDIYLGDHNTKVMASIEKSKSIMEAWEKNFLTPLEAAKNKAKREYDEMVADLEESSEDYRKATENYKKTIEDLEKEHSELYQGIKRVGQSIEDNIIDNLTDAVMAAKSWKDALVDALKSIASELMKVGLQLIWVSSLKKLFGDTKGGGGFGSIFASFFSSLMGGANGGIFPGGFQSFAIGGIAKKPTLGLVGEGRYNEAIVPLPDGKSIPVQMKGRGESINTTINVNVNSPSGTKEENEKMGSQISDVINYKFKEMLSKEMRVGGMLNRSAY